MGGSAGLLPAHAGSSARCSFLSIFAWHENNDTQAVLETVWALERQLAAEVFEDKVPDAADVALRTGPAAPAAAGPSADEALPALRPTSAEPQRKGLAGALPAALRSRHASSRPPRWAPCHHRRCALSEHNPSWDQVPIVALIAAADASRHRLQVGAGGAGGGGVSGGRALAAGHGGGRVAERARVRGRARLCAGARRCNVCCCCASCMQMPGFFMQFSAAEGATTLKYST